ncbi:hypothetical protein Tco_0452437 [Tanacetum coccineum]
MSRTNPRAKIVSEEQLVPSANKIKMTKNNQCVVANTNITDTMLRFVVRILTHHKLYKPVFLTATMPQPDSNKPYTKPPIENQILRFIKILGYIEDPKAKMTSVSTLSVLNRSVTDFASLIWDEFEWQSVDRITKPTKMSKLMYTRFTKLIINHFLSCNKRIPRRFDSDMHRKGQDLPLTKLTNTVKGTYIFGMEIPDTMIDDAFKKSARYKYYRTKKAESKKVKAAKEPEEQHVSLVKSGKGKGYICLGNQEVNVPNAFKKNDMPRKTRSLTVSDNIVEEPVAVELAKSISLKDQRRQQRDIMTQLTINSQIDKDVEDKYTKWGQTCKGPIVEDPDTQSLLYLRKGPKASRLESLKQAKQAVTREGSSAAHNKYYEFENISAIDSDATQDSYHLNTDEERNYETDDSDDFDMDLFEDEPKGDDDTARFGVFVYNKSTEPLKSTYLNPTVTISSLEYIQSLLNDPPANELTDFLSNPVYTDAHTTSVVANPEGNPEKLEALTSINVSEAIHKAVHAKVLTKMKKLLPTHVPKVLANYVKTCLNNYVLEVMQNNQISLFTKPSTSADDLSDMDLKLKMLNKIH